MEANEKASGYAEKLVVLLCKKNDIDVSNYEMNEIIMGMFVELEHGSKGEEKSTNLTNDDPFETLQIVLAHLNEIPDYYTRLNKMEKEADSVKTEEPEKEIEDEDKIIEKKPTMESISKRFQELCGIIENTDKRQLSNTIYQDKSKKTLLKEEVDPNKFSIAKFSNDGIGKEKSEEEIELYKMLKKGSSTVNKNLRKTLQY